MTERHTDHSAFIARHHRVEPSAGKRGADRRAWALFFFAIAFVYVLGMVVVAAMTAMKMTTSSLIVYGEVFGAALMLGIVLQWLMTIRSKEERERKLLKEVMEGSRGARLVTDTRDRTIYFNKKFADLCGGLGSPSLASLMKLFPNKETTDAHFRTLADEVHRGLTETIEMQGVLRNKERWYTVTAQPIDGWRGHVHWRVDDITEQRTVDRAIREEREKLIDFTDNAPVGFFSVDANGRFMFVNATLARWLGQDIQTLLTEGNLHTYLGSPPKDAAPYDIIEGGGAKQSAELMLKGQGGRGFAVSISQAVVHEANGAIRTRGVVHDLTTEQAMRQALKASEHKFQRFFEEAPLGIALLTSSGILEDCNAAIATLLGYAVEDLEGKTFASLIADSDQAGILAALERVEKGRHMGVPVEVTLNGRERPVVVKLYARRMEGSDSMVLHVSDLTQQKTLEQQFVQSQKMQAIGQLAGGVAHDFNNLLTAMIGFCDLLLLRHKPGDPSFSDIMQIKQNANRAANLVRQLLAFSRQQTLRPKVQDITDILTELSHLLRRLIGANIELEVLHGADLGLVRVDVGQMEQVLINLAVNARDAMDMGGRLTIRTSNFDNDKPMERSGDTMPRGHWVRLDVEDTGCGIPKENLSRILEPFFTTKEVGQGTGLGLATVYGIIRQTGGYLHIASEVGRGTVFSIYLPRLSEAESQNNVKERVSGDDEDSGRDLTGTAKILLVEDEDAVRTFSVRALTNKGYQVSAAESGEAALSIVESLGGAGKIDLLVTDVIMPQMDGPTLAKMLREQCASLKIIFMSGYTEEKLKDHLGENIWFLQKPFTLKQLAAKVKEALEE